MTVVALVDQADFLFLPDSEVSLGGDWDEVVAKTERARRKCSRR